MQAMENAQTEYKKYKAKKPSSVEKDYSENTNSSRIIGGLIFFRKEDLLKKIGNFSEVR